MNANGSSPARVVIWRRILDEKSFELAALSHTGAGHQVKGLALLDEGGVPMRVDYRIDCDRDWNTRTAQVLRAVGFDVRKLTLAADRGVWRCNGEILSLLDGCIDIDLGITPSTNALPINRLGMTVGETRTIRAAWVRFPECDVVPAEQSYERLDSARYRYRSLASGFTALLDVDDLGLPIRYEKIWERIAIADGADAVDALIGAGAKQAG